MTRVGHTFVPLGSVQPILPCGSKLLYWFLWVQSLYRANTTEPRPQAHNFQCYTLKKRRCATLKSWEWACQGQSYITVIKFVKVYLLKNEKINLLTFILKKLATCMAEISSTLIAKNNERASNCDSWS